MTEPFSMNSYLGMRILALVRDGDYAHAGEEEAIDVAMSGVEKDARRLILDAGCGRGGTAEYLHRNGWGRVIGLDIQAESIKAAEQNYPSRCVDERPDLICMFNAYYCFKDQSKALHALLKVAQPHTQMIIFDHVDRGSYQDDPLMDAGMPFLPNPLRLSEVKERMTSTGWRAPDVLEIHDAYIGWYTRLLAKIEHAHDKIAAIAGEPGYQHVHRLYKGLLSAARQKRLGAAIIITMPA
jgi:SAM-dependent methyltransferase